MQALEYNVCKALPGCSLESLDNTDIDTLFAFIEYINAKNTEKNEEFVEINGKKYKKVRQCYEQQLQQF